MPRHGLGKNSVFEKHHCIWPAHGIGSAADNQTAIIWQEMPRMASADVIREKRLNKPANIRMLFTRRRHFNDLPVLQFPPPAGILRPVHPVEELLRGHHSLRRYRRHTFPLTSPTPPPVSPLRSSPPRSGSSAIPPSRRSESRGPSRSSCLRAVRRLGL